MGYVPACLPICIANQPMTGDIKNYIHICVKFSTPPRLKTHISRFDSPYPFVIHFDNASFMIKLTSILQGNIWNTRVCISYMGERKQHLVKKKEPPPLASVVNNSLFQLYYLTTNQPMISSGAAIGGALVVEGRLLHVVEAIVFCSQSAYLLTSVNTPGLLLWPHPLSLKLSIPVRNKN